MKVAFQGEAGAFSEMMAIQMFGQPQLLPCKTFKEVFDSVNSGKAEAGVIPIENSLTGRINDSTDLLIDSDLKINREGVLKIVHCLIVKQNTSLKTIKRIYAHPEALNQCRKFLGKLDCELISWYDGAGAARKIKRSNPCALVGSERVAEVYNLQVLKKGIQDSKNNMTRFIVISSQSNDSTGKDKTSIVFTTKHEPGALLHALEPLDRFDINLTKLESMPSKDKPWQYMFLVDFTGHQKDENVKKALKELNKHCISVKVLGSYAEA